MKKHFWSYPKLKELLEKHPEDKNKIQDIFDEIHGEFNEKLVSRTSKFFDKTFRKLYDQVNLQVPFDFDLDELQKKHHIILVPNHQSHADYLAITYLFYKTFKKALYVAGGINLNIFLFGRFFRKTGAFFIRRSFSKDIPYRTSFEAYVYALLKSDRILEFFFEGGRSRTGKLLAPRYGLFQILLETHSLTDKKKSLLFVPVSIAHEHVPEEKAHSHELGGGIKKKEKAAQVLKIYKLFNKKLGSIHATLGKGIEVKEISNLRADTQRLAFACFKTVGKNMPITPTSLLSLILLDAPSGVTNWESIESKAKEIITYCKRFLIPLTPSLSESFENSKNNILEALNILISNKKVEVLKNEHLGEIFYSVKKKERIHLLYFKNMILHHFVLPAIMNTVLYQLKERKISNVEELTDLLLEKRSELLFEFYLPSNQELLANALEIMSYSTGREIENLSEVVKLTDDDVDQITSKINVFSSGLSYINECYYLAAKALDHLRKKEFTLEKFTKIVKEIYTIELKHGRMVQFEESFSVPVVKSALNFYKYKGCLVGHDDKFKVVDIDSVFELKKRFAEDLNINLIMNLSKSAQD